MKMEERFQKFLDGGTLPELWIAAYGPTKRTSRLLGPIILEKLSAEEVSKSRILFTFRQLFHEFSVLKFDLKEGAIATKIVGFTSMLDGDPLLQLELPSPIRVGESLAHFRMSYEFS